MEGASKPFSTDNAWETQRLELALESAGIGTWELNLHTSQLRWCRRTKALFDFTGSDIVELKMLLDHIDKKDINGFTEQIQTALHGALPFCLELRTAKDEMGQQRWLQCRGRSHVDPDTGTVRVSGTFSDITNEAGNRVHLKEQQKQSRSFQTIVEQAPMAIGLLSGPELVIELGNDKIFEVWGKSPSVTGSRLQDALPEIQGQGFIELLQNVFNTGMPYTGSGYPATLERNGRCEQVYFDFVYTPMRQENGAITGIMVMANEVTAQYNAIRQLESSEARFKALIGQAPMAISLFVGKDLVVELANQPMIGYWGKDSSVIGKPLAEALPELAGQPFLGILDQILQTGIAYSSKSDPVDLKVDGKLSTYYFNFTYKPIFDSNGSIYGIINMAFDVTDQVMAQKALQESESRLKTVIASAPAAINLFVGRELVVEMPNQAFIDIVGKGPDITGKPLRQLMPELESQPFLKILDDVYTTGIIYQSFGTQADIVRSGEISRNFYDITYSPLLDSAGKVYAILNISADVTERVHVEKQVQASQLQLLSLFEQSPVGIAMISRDNLTFTMVNPFFGRLVGRQPRDIMAKPLLEALPDISGQGFVELLKQVMDTGIPFHSKEQQVNVLYENEPQTIYVNLACQPQRELDGSICGVLVVATDLTEQVLSRRKIEETETFLRGAIDLAELGTYSIDLGTGILEYSERLKRWFGVEKEDLITFEKVYAAISEADLPAVVAAVDQAISQGSDGLYDMEYSMDKEKTGFARILHAQGKVLYDDNGKPVTMIGTAQDVTMQRKINLALEQQVQHRTQELAAANEELAAINEEYLATNEELSDSNNRLHQSNVNLQQFAYVASHDLQEPLRKIQSFSNLLDARYAERLGNGADLIQRMQASAHRMSALINDLLAFSRLTTQTEMTGTVPLTRIVYEVLNDLELAVSESSASVTVRQLPEFQGDPVQLNQLFLNLVSNALKFRKPGVSPVIQITSEIIPVSQLPASLTASRTAGSYYKIDVADNGIGFDQQHADRIFQLFQRLHGRSQYSGTGIGLAICERVAVNHGGGISVISNPGQGAVFSIFLPVS